MRSLLIVVALLGACRTDEGEGNPAPDAAMTPTLTTTVDAGAPDAPTVLPDAAPSGTVCAMKEPLVQLIYTCQFAWSQCSGTSTANHEISCQIQAAGQLRFSQCGCIVNGVEQQQFVSTTICGSTSWAALETEANEACGWNLR